MRPLPQRQRVAAYAVILRDEHVLLSRIAPRISRDELWTLPGGGLEHGEDPRDAVVREVHEETGLDARVSEAARVYSAHMPGVWRDGRRVDAHALRIVYDGWVPADSPEPRVVEVDGSTVEAAWVLLADVESGAVPVTPMVREALLDLGVRRMQRVAVYAVLLREDRPVGPELLLTRISARGHHPGAWTLPGGGLDHGESPRAALVREVAEECGVEPVVGALLDVHDVHFEGTAPSGRREDYHGVHLLFAARLAEGTDPDAVRVVEIGGTTDAVAWRSVADLRAGGVELLDVARHALDFLVGSSTGLPAGHPEHAPEAP